VITIAADRFERRLVEEITNVRLEIGREGAALRTEMAQGFATARKELSSEITAVRTDLGAEVATVRTDLGADIAKVYTGLIKWAFVVCIGQVAAITALVGLLLGSVGPR
jgi:hypothetical protein